MSVAEADDIRASYRVVQDPGWQIQKHYPDKGWRVVGYCGSEQAARAGLERHVANAVRWAAMTDDERITSMLRGQVASGDAVHRPRY